MNKKYITTIAILVFAVVILLFLNLKPEVIVDEPIVSAPVATSSNPQITVEKGVTVTSPTRNAEVKSPLTIAGHAKGAWFFEASFPVKLVDANGKMLAQGPAQAKGEWMTTEQVDFEATLTFLPPNTKTGTLILENDNPSGLPERSERIEIPVTFADLGKVTVKLYYPNSTLTNADVCSQDSLAPVERQIAKTATPLTDTINLLIQGGLTVDEKARGFSTEFPNTGFKLTSAAIVNGTAKLTFTEVPGFTGGGSCRMAIMAGSIAKTAKQFPSVTNVTFSPESLFQP